jgi:hypothetical protein
MPRTENRRAIYTLEIDTAQIAALGGKTYLQTSDPEGALSMMGDSAVHVVGDIPELWSENKIQSKYWIKRHFIEFIKANSPPGIYNQYLVVQKTPDFSSWTVQVDLRYIP